MAADTNRKKLYKEPDLYESEIEDESRGGEKKKEEREKDKCVGKKLNRGID